MPNNIRTISPQYLADMQKLNLYSPNNVYDLNNSVLANSISNVISALGEVNINIDTSLLGNISLPNTPIQQIGNIELAKALANRVSDNLKTNLLTNVSVSSTGIAITDPNYWNISNSQNVNSLSSLLDIMTNYKTLSNPIPQISSIFNSDASDNYLKGNRGQGQIDEYNNNLNQNDYNPDIDGNQYGFNKLNIINGTSPDSILYKTNQIVAQNNLINGYPSTINILSGNSINLDALAFVDPNNLGILISNGDGTYTDDSQTKFLRVFNRNKTYSGTTSLMKFKNGYAGTNSVLQTVFPNISPLQNQTSIKNLMFSIENLAYVDSKFLLKPYEVGINGGRVMWFPPYNIKISESETSDWSSEKFIGRTEPIYTYNSSERSVSLSFSLIVDYPSQFANNSWKSASNNEFDKFFREDNQLDLNRRFSVNDVKKLEVIRQQQTPLTTNKITNSHISNFENNNKLTIHFDNDNFDLKQTLTSDNSNGDGQKDNDDFFNRINDLILFLNTDEGSLYTLNIDGFSSQLFSTKFSSTISKKYNDILSFLRGKSIYSFIFNKLNDNSNALVDYSNTPQSLVSPKADQYGQSNPKFKINIHGYQNAINDNDTNQTIGRDVVDRKATIYISYNPNLDSSIQPPIENIQSKTNRLNDNNLQESKINSSNVQGNDILFFDRFKNDDDKALILTKYSEKLKNFSPVFNSQTPEDFNTRLTFLSQCTKQGNALSGVTNSVFGRPPVCILRIGDFYHTKIIITNITKDFEPLVWDMNPEGIGMQPMLCHVSLSLKLIGGQSLDGVITKLQNALDYNFYANTQVYDDNALKGAAQSTIINNQSNPSSQSINAVTQAKITVDQITQAQATVTKPVSNVFGLQKNDQTLSYNEKFSDVIEFLISWSNTLLFIVGNNDYNRYLLSGTDNIDINSYNNNYSSLSVLDKNNNITIYNTINGFYKQINNLKFSFNDEFGQLTNISNTSLDGNLNLSSGTEFTNYQTMTTMINNFYNTYILNIANYTSIDVTNQINILNKYNNYTVSSIPYST